MTSSGEPIAKPLAPLLIFLYSFQGFLYMKNKVHNRVKWVIALSIMIAILIAVAGCGKKQPSEIDYAYTHGIFFGCGNLELMREYIEADKARANTLIYDKTIKKEVSPLYLIQADNYDPRFAEYLLEEAANPNKAYDDVTPLMCANGITGNTVGGLELQELLIKHGADVNAADKSGYTALDYAIKNTQDAAQVEFLLTNMAKVSTTTLKLVYENKENAYSDSLYMMPRLIFEAAKKQSVSYNQYALFAATVLGDTNQVIQLLKKQNNQYESSLPFYAAAWCKPKALDYFVAHGFNLNSTDANHNSLLWIAASTGNLDVVKYLVKKGASLDFHAYNPGDEDPLKVAVINNHYAVAKYLLEKGAKFNIDKKLGYDGADGDSGNQPMTAGDCLQGAVVNGNMQMIELLKQHGYPFNKNTYYRAMKIAIDHNQLAALQYFLKKGANPNYVDNRFSDNFSLLKSCALYGTVDSLKLLNQYGATIKTSNSGALSDAVDTGNEAVAQYLLNHGVNANAQFIYSDGSRSTLAVEAACNHGYFDMIKLLIDYRANVNDKYIEINLVLGQAAYSSHILQYLVDHGAVVNVQDKDDGSTPLMLAASMHRDKNVEILLKAGADTSLKNKKDQTALDIAKADKQPDKNIIKLLEGN